MMTKRKITKRSINNRYSPVLLHLHPLHPWNKMTIILRTPKPPHILNLYPHHPILTIICYSPMLTKITNRSLIDFIMITLWISYSINHRSINQGQILLCFSKTLRPYIVKNMEVWLFMIRVQEWSVIQSCNLTMRIIHPRKSISTYSLVRMRWRKLTNYFIRYPENETSHVTLINSSSSTYLSSSLNASTVALITIINSNSSTLLMYLNKKISLFLTLDSRMATSKEQSKLITLSIIYS